MVSPHDAIAFLVKTYGFDESSFSEHAHVTMGKETFKVALLYHPEQGEKELPLPHKKQELFTSLKGTTCYIERGMLKQPAKRVAYMMCSSVFIWIATKADYEQANQWFKVAFQRSLTEFVFAEEQLGKETIYFFKGCPDITMREQL